ncbi:MAG: DUF4442 domain-containing protein [Glaciecola sp.]|jgi:acyl-coenzyme A thioesterase PaaI-like protein
MTDHLDNPLRKFVLKLDSKPHWLRRFIITQVFRRTVKLAGTAGQDILETDLQSVTFVQKNRRKVQNHIGGVHAAATALLGESASGFIVGVNIPGDKLPLLKSMHVDYTKRATGNLRAVASLTDEQLQRMRTEEKGEVSVKVTITDDAGIEPVNVEYIWAWVPKKKK